MQVLTDNLWLCSDCLLAAVNGDYSGLEYYYPSPEQVHDRKQTITNGLQALGANLVPDFDSETGEGIRGFSASACDCCRVHLAGERHRFAILG